jgi:hypothetical protein
MWCGGPAPEPGGATAATAKGSNPTARPPHKHREAPTSSRSDLPRRNSPIDRRSPPPRPRPGSRTRTATAVPAIVPGMGRGRAGPAGAGDRAGAGSRGRAVSRGPRPRRHPIPRRPRPPGAIGGAIAKGADTKGLSPRGSYRVARNRRPSAQRAVDPLREKITHSSAWQQSLARGET